MHILELKSQIHIPTYKRKHTLTQTYTQIHQTQNKCNNKGLLEISMQSKIVPLIHVY